MNDIVLNKTESIERCLKQIRSYYHMPSQLPFEEDFLRQDAIAINMQRACEQAIDLANYTIKVQKIGLPKESRDSFLLLAQHKIITEELADKLCRMIGFRNTLVHEYQRLDIQLMIDIIENHLDDLLLFTSSIMHFFGSLEE
ncbi:MAG: DUF86 domain-containing protein [Desulfohalobiaceae bacterium]|nr:DUF86 domain-containing protein [Desulfohalobiaceae bacterium]